MLGDGGIERSKMPFHDEGKSDPMVTKPIRTVVVAAVSAALLALTSTAAQASTRTALSGTVNCTGSGTTYGTVRYMTEPARTDLLLTKAAGSLWGGYTMTIGVKIVNTGVYHTTKIYGANHYGTLQSGNNYAKNTQFKMYAAMTPSSGTCSNSWSGTLTY